MNSLRNWLRPFSARSANRLPAGRARLGLETLEDRQVPTVVFQPHFAGTAETSTASDYASSLQSTPAVLTFAGTYWQTAQGQQDQQTLTADVQTLLASPYLSGLT